MIDDTMLHRLIEAVGAVDDGAPLDGTPYEIREEIGRGGMGVVYRAWDAKLEREIALKITEEAHVPEARIAASLEHPGIVPVYDAGRLADGRAYCAMRLVRGLPLDRYVAENVPPVSTRIAIVQKICDAVAFAHSRGVVHRDLKPANIMVGTFGEVAVLDWGVADRAEQDRHPAAARAVVGTRNYMAPEQAAANPATPLADVYSLGAVLQSLLPADPPRALSAIAAKAMRENPAERYPDVGALSSDLSRFLDGFAVEAHAETLAERAIRFARRNRTLLLLVGAYFAARIAIYFFSGR